MLMNYGYFISRLPMENLWDRSGKKLPAKVPNVSIEASACVSNLPGDIF